MSRDLYEPADYWRTLFLRGIDVRSVGHPHLSRAFNLAMHESGRLAVRSSLAVARIPSRPRVLDVGSGSGLWIDFWECQGADVTGCGLDEGAVEQLSARWPDKRFVHADVASLPDLGGFDVVSAMNVLLHVTDRTRFHEALGGIARLLDRGGVLVALEPAVRHRWWGPPFTAASSSVARGLDEWIAATRAFELRLESVRAAGVVLASPVDTRHKWTWNWLAKWWIVLSLLDGGVERRGRVLAAVFGPLDRAAVRFGRLAPSGKCLVFRKL